MGRREKCWQCDQRRTDVSLRMSDDRLCQDCDDSNTAACADLRNRDVEHTSPTSPIQSQGQATDSASTTATGTLNNNKSSGNNNGVIIDELICFVQNKIDILPPISIGDLCTSTFSEHDIEASKRRLFELCADDSCTRMRKRIGPKRSVQNVNDIIRLLQEKGSGSGSGKLYWAQWPVTLNIHSTECM